jgi:hypothetical protein
MTVNEIQIVSHTDPRGIVNIGVSCPDIDCSDCPIVVMNGKYFYSNKSEWEEFRNKIVKQDFLERKRHSTCSIKVLYVRYKIKSDKLHALVEL